MTTSMLAPPDFLVSARALMEYRGMFRLSNEELRESAILDCPGGAASFGAEVRRLGGAVVSVDPIYGHDRERIQREARDAVVRTSETSAEHPHLFSWTFFRSVGHHRQVRADACEAFLADHADVDARQWYVPAALPALPFPNAAFDLTLSSHLLFTYDHLIDVDASVAALTELARVTARQGEVRVFPLVSASGGRSPQVDEVRAALGARGLETRIERVWYEAQRGGNEFLSIRRR
jgi:hypothetical protein